MNNNNNNVDHNPSENDRDSIGNIDVDDIPTFYNSLCHAPTGDTDSNHYWCFENDDPFPKRNNMINNNIVGPSPSYLYDNEGSLIEDDLPEYTFPCHLSIGDTVSNIQLIVVSSSSRGGVRKLIKGNSNNNNISPIYDHSDCPNEANVNNSNKSDNTVNDETIDLNNDGPYDDILSQQ